MLQDKFLSNLNEVFLVSGLKTVTKNEMKKDAISLRKKQSAVMNAAGLKPGLSKDKTVVEILDVTTGETHEVSYYQSIRGSSGRLPEPRIGRIKWLSEGVRFILGTDGKRLFLIRERCNGDDSLDVKSRAETVKEKLYDCFDKKWLAKLASKKRSKPNKRIVTEFERSLLIAIYTKKRASYLCEIEDCSYTGFLKDDNTKYIEVHHIKTLADGGLDSIDNTAAVCPNCHRKLHFGKVREKMSILLKRRIEKLNLELLK